MVRERNLTNHPKESRLLQLMTRIVSQDARFLGDPGGHPVKLRPRRPVSHPVRQDAQFHGDPAPHPKESHLPATG